MTGTGWTVTRQQLAAALTAAEVRPVLLPGLGRVVDVFALADAILAQLPEAHVVTEYATAWGGEDPNDCAGILVYDDEAEAEEHVQWIRDSYVARRTVTRSRWERVPAEAATDEALSKRGGPRHSGTGHDEGRHGTSPQRGSQGVVAPPGGDRP